MVRGRAVSLLALTALAGLASHALRADPLPACLGGTIPTSQEATGAHDGATLRLADGHEVRLAGVIAASDIDGDQTAVTRATAALDRLVAGKRVLLHSLPEAADRYGRFLAQVVLADETGIWVQGRLVADGMLRVGPEAGEPACSEALIVQERTARAAKAGLWAEPHFVIESADNLAALNAAIGRFAVVEGRVARIGETPSRTYIDFGRRYSEDFTITIPRASRAAFQAAGIDLKALRGKRIRARGVLFSSGGPAIEVHKPASIEIVQGSGT
ncbi:MAG TPA: thermonuclease family protein [Xanthobacteraceae bacterium]|nr:thermonuclease family protein [Xanthobacteraceae bacterium]